MDDNSTPRGREPLAAAALAATAASVLLLAGAMAAYPGGRWSDPSAPGYDVLHNYLCDLNRPVAHDGQTNALGAGLARAGVLAQAAGLLPLWFLLPRFVPRWRAAGQALRACGVLASLLLPCVAFTPSDGSSRTHALAIGAAGAPGLLALLLGAAFVLVGWRGRPRLAALTLACVLASAASGVLYLFTFVAAWPDAWSLPLAQKVAWLLLVAWIVAVARAAPARSPGA
jgi:MFS family permease